MSIKARPYILKSVFSDVLVRLLLPRQVTPRLPPELVLQILEHLDLDLSSLFHAHIAELAPTFKTHYAALRVFAQVSRQWSITTADLLQRHIYLDSDRSAVLWNPGLRGGRRPDSMVLAGAVSSHQAAVCVRRCGPTTRPDSWPKFHPPKFARPPLVDTSLVGKTAAWLRART